MNIALILAGCGHLDGSEIRETILTLLYLSEANIHVQLYAPDSDQHHVMHHHTGESTTQTRNILTEAARLARGKISPLNALKVTDHDALIIPGGFGVAKNLSDFAFRGASMTPDPLFASIVRDFYEARKPIGAICIAPAIVSGILHDHGITVTIGDDASVASIIRQHGNVHHESATHRAIVDSRHRIVSCSAYMRDDVAIHEVGQGIHELVDAIIMMVQESHIQAA
ncbi:MAG: isoprenoid biosynthesis protein ElbB [Alphaproteobacteria bacterium]|nr:MAG: isoprenoid biosynthesis protein ElbB [Alphaproteobacteria bacterium]TAF41974.1 MAG: isoprenoid biosynthesis protein ElbB [Alphaproteobacteria bacterium]TAF76582.1 MAG: isoprenoid biosynthesis protein ElbB [Alphaproteobacteria bacterium]